ncbi:AMIN-like domain-containing (lipo)protein [Thalassiella azotivora]
MVRRRLVSLLLAPVAAAAVLLAPVAPAAAGPYCGIWWGSLPEIVESYDRGVLVDVRSGRHPCFDRLVLDVRGDVSGYRVSYVPAVYSEGQGALVPLRGGARIQLVALVPAYDESGEPTYLPVDRRELVHVAGYRTLRQVAWAGTFEGQTTLGVGVRARLPFRVFLLDGPGDRTRLVLDVAHRW